MITSAEEVQNLVENKQVIIVALYNDNEVITQNVINTSEGRRDKYNSCSSTSGASTKSQKSFFQFYSLLLFNNRERFFNKEALKQIMHQEIKNATMNGIILTKI